MLRYLVITELVSEVDLQELNEVTAWASLNGPERQHG